MKTALCCAVMLALSSVTAGCKKKDGKKEETPAAAKPTAEKPACPGGQLIDQGKCVAVVTPERVAGVVKQAQKMATLSDALTKIDAVKAPLALIKLLMTTDAWKNLAKQSKDLAGAEESVKALDAGVKELEKLAASATSGRKAVDLLVQKLSSIQGGTPTFKSVDELRAYLGGELRSALEPLAKEAKKLTKEALDPAVAQIKKMLEWTEAVCAVVKLSGSDDLKKQCAQSKSAGDAALAWIAEIEKLPATMVSDVIKGLDVALDQIVDSKALDQLVK